MLFDICRCLRGKYFDIVWGCHPPRTPQNGATKNQFLERLNFGCQWFLTEVESRTLGSRPRPRTQKNFEAKDRPSRGQGQEPRTQTQAFSKKKVFKNFFQAKKVFKIFFSGDLYLRKPKKKFFADFPRRFWRFPTKFQRFKNSAVPEPRTGQFSRTWGFEAKTKDFKMCPRGQGRPRGLHLWFLITVDILQTNILT